jgi:hypothetical protein
MKNSKAAKSKKSDGYTGTIDNSDDDDDDDDESTGPSTPEEQENDTAHLGRRKDDRRMMDDLLDRLRSGESLNHSRQQRRARRRQLNIETSMMQPSQSNTTCTSSDSNNLPLATLDSNPGDDDFPLSAEDLLRSLQNDD